MSDHTLSHDGYTIPTVCNSSLLIGGAAIYLAAGCEGGSWSVGCVIGSYIAHGLGFWNWS